MPARLGHRIRWAAVALLFGAWFVALMTGGGLANVLLAAAIVALLYQLLAVDRGAR